MKKNIFILIAIVLVGINGFILYELSHGAAVAFQQTFDGFGVTPPQLTSTLFSSIEYWWLMLSIIAILSFLPVFFGWLKTSMAVSLAFIVALVAVVYGPIIQMGNAI